MRNCVSPLTCVFSKQTCRDENIRLKMHHRFLVANFHVLHLKIHCLSKLGRDKQRYLYNVLFPFSEYLRIFATTKFLSLRLIPEKCSLLERKIILIIQWKQLVEIHQKSIWPLDSLVRLGWWVDGFWSSPKEKNTLPRGEEAETRDRSHFKSLQFHRLCCVLTEAWTDLCLRAAKMPKSPVNI